MRVPKIALRYAKVLFDLGEPRQERLNCLQLLVECLAFLPKFKRLMASPQMSKADKEKLLGKAVGEDPALLHFLTTLLNKGRFTYLPEILASYQQMLRENAGFLDTKLITAVKADEATKIRLIHELENNYKMKVFIEEEIDPTMIGGAILLIDNHMIDFSIKDRLLKLKNDLLALRP